MQKLKIEIIEGNEAPRYVPEETEQLEVKKAIITAHGMASGEPLVDIQMEDKDGKEYFFMITGALAIGLADAVKGVSLRHSKPAPTN